VDNNSMIKIGKMEKGSRKYDHVQSFDENEVVL
jgi:hypothetical protein